MLNLFRRNTTVDTAQVLVALSRVVHPESRRDIVQLKMVKDLTVSNGQVSFTILLDEVGAPVRAPIERQVRASLAGVRGVRDVKINWGVRNVPRPQLTDKIENLNVKYVVAIASGKGGVGKSTVAVNVACALANQGLRVGLLDADVHGPNVPLMMGVSREQPMAFGEQIIPIIAHNVKLMSMGFLVPAETPVIWRGPMLSQALRQFLTDVVWGTLDFLIVDLPPGTGDVQLSLVQSLTLSGAVLVTTPQEVALADVVKGLEMFRQLQAPILGVVENMSYFRCPDCGHRHEIFAHGGGRRLSEKYDAPFLGEIPIDPAARSGGDAGKPVVLAQPESPAARAFGDLARAIQQGVERLPQRASLPREFKADPALPIVN
ncbi:MAG: Mrp/NBP35 family ATP-binding protein [Chloroflexi bacterium]|nr:Mrp/NBP35 family ATP-binding protein [Chloroflexota bacterium]